MYIREIIDIPKGTKFLSDILLELPKDCIFNKSVVGSGGTHLALVSKEKYVICVPFKNLIKNKCEKYNKLGYDILGVDGDTSVDEIRDYLNKVDNPKIMVTYNSLGKVADILEGYNTLDEYNILIDEFHLLLTSYVFRNDAVRTVLDCYKAFKSYCFMTATPVEDDFMLDELVDEDLVIAEWEECLEVTVKSVQCQNSVKSYVTEEIKNYLSGEKEGNAYFFVNSVKFIKEIIDECNLSNSVCRAIWSQNNNEEDVKIKNSSINSSPKKINFLTSCCFEGVDLFDKEGVTYIISDGDRQHTLIDISTSFSQISGRIRDSKYKDIIYHIYTSTRYSGLKSIEEFKEFSQGIINELPTIKIELTNILSISVDKYNKITNAVVSEANDKYIGYDKYTKKLEYDNNLVKFDMFNYKICKCLYSLKVNLQTEYLLKGFNIEYQFYDDSKIEQVKVKGKNFKETVIELEDNPDDKELYEKAFKKYDFLKEAINKLGFDGICDLKYKTTNVKSRLIIMSDKGEENKILRLLETKLDLEYRNFYTNVELKDIFTQVYKDLDIIKLAKGSDIIKYYNTKIGTIRIDKKASKGFYIYTEKVILG